MINIEKLKKDIKNSDLSYNILIGDNDPEIVRNFLIDNGFRYLESHFLSRPEYYFVIAYSHKGYVMMGLTKYIYEAEAIHKRFNIKFKELIK